MGHVAARCKVVLRRGPYHSRIHVRSKKLMSSSTQVVKEDAHVSVPVLNPTPTSIIPGPVTCMSV